MKVLLLNGSPHEKGCTYRALTEVAGALTKEGIEAEIVHIAIRPFMDVSDAANAPRRAAVSSREIRSMHFWIRWSTRMD